VLHAELNIQVPITVSEKNNNDCYNNCSINTTIPDSFHYKKHDNGWCVVVKHRVVFSQTEDGQMNGWKNEFPTMYVQRTIHNFRDWYCHLIKN
jgi:hypothetical protein